MKVIDPQHLTYISELVDEIALEKPIDWESFNYDAVKEVAIQGAIETFYDTMDSTKLSESEKTISFLATMSYLTLENMMLWIRVLDLESKSK